jgi:hypothetical protein
MFGIDAGNLGWDNGEREFGHAPVERPAWEDDPSLYPIKSAGMGFAAILDANDSARITINGGTVRKWESSVISPWKPYGDAVPLRWTFRGFVSEVACPTMGGDTTPAGSSYVYFGGSHRMRSGISAAITEVYNAGAYAIGGGIATWPATNTTPGWDFTQGTAGNQPTDVGGAPRGDGVDDYLDAAGITVDDLMQTTGVAGTATFLVYPLAALPAVLGTNTAQSPYSNPAVFSDGLGYVGVHVHDAGVTFGAYDGVGRDLGGGPNDGWQMVTVMPPSSVIVNNYLLIQIRWDGTAGTMELRVGDAASGTMSAWSSAAFGGVQVTTGVPRLFGNYALSAMFEGYIYAHEYYAGVLEDERADEQLRDVQARVGVNCGAPSLGIADAEKALAPDGSGSVEGTIVWTVSRLDTWTVGSTLGYDAKGVWSTSAYWLGLNAVQQSGVPKHASAFFDAGGADGRALFVNTGFSEWHLTTQRQDRGRHKLHKDGDLTTLQQSAANLDGNPNAGGQYIFFGYGAGGADYMQGGVALWMVAATTGWEDARIRDVDRWAMAEFVTAAAVNITGTGSLALSPLSLSASGQVRFIGTATHTLSSLSSSANGVETFTGTATCALQPLSGAASGAETFTGTATLAASPLSSSATGSETFSGTCSLSLSSLSSSGSGQLRFTGTGTCALSPLSSSATGAETFSGSATHALQPFSSSASGVNTPPPVTGTCSLALSPLSSSGTALETFTGTCALALSSLSGTGSGAETFSGSATLAASPLASSASGNVANPVTGTATLACSPLSSSASGIETFSGSATLAASSLSAAATGAETFSGTCSLDLQPLASTGSGVVANPVTGTASLTCSPLSASAVAIETFTGTASLALSPLSSQGTGAETFTGTASLALAPLLGDASGNVANPVTGTATLDLKSLGLDAVGAWGVSGTATLALQALSSSGAGAETFAGAAALDLRPLDASATGAETFTGAATLALSPLSAEGAGGQGVFFTGTGSLALSPLAATAAGEETFSGAANLALAPLNSTAAAEQRFTGSATLALQSLAGEASGNALNPVTGTASLALQPLASTAAGAETFSGAAALSLSSLSPAGVGGSAVTGTAILALSPLDVSGSGVYVPPPVTGTATLALSPFAGLAFAQQRFTGSAQLALSSLVIDGAAFYFTEPPPPKPGVARIFVQPKARARVVLGAVALASVLEAASKARASSVLGPTAKATTAPTPKGRAKPKA